MMRIKIAALSLSAVGLVALVGHEGYTDSAVQPLPGDRWTYGFGMTTRDDGTPVQPGDRTTPTRALVSTLKDINKREEAVRKCLSPETVMYPHEWDFVVDFSFNVGVGNFCSSRMAALFSAGRHADACLEPLRWFKYQGRDCRIRANKCYGLIERREKQVQQCLGN